MLANELKPVRVPLVGTYNTRLFQGAAGVTSSVVGIGIVGDMIVGALSTASSKDQKFINFIPDRVDDPMNGSSKFYVHKRPGLAPNNTPSAGNVGSALRLWIGSNSEVISAFGATNSTIYNGTTSIGTLTGVATDITETFVGTTPNLVIPTDSNKAYFYPSGGAMTQITDVDFPGNAGKTITGTFVHMNGYAYIMCTDGTIYNSDLGSVSSWTSSSFISANMYPDKGVGLSRYKNLIVAFGKESIEFFTDVGNPFGSPLQKLQEATLHIGCLGPYSLCQFEDNIAWIAGSDTGSFSVYILDGYQPKRISTNAIDTFIAQSGASNVYVTSCKLNGKTLLFVICNTFSYVYVLEDGIWHEWQPASGGSILWHKFAASSASTSAIFAISRTATSGKVYKISMTSPVYQDDGVTYDCTIITSKVDLNTERRKILNKFTLVGDTTATTIYVAYSDDDYTTYSSERSIDCSKDRKYLNNLGAFRRRSFRLRNSDTIPIRLEAIELEVREGLH